MWQLTLLWSLQKPFGCLLREAYLDSLTGEVPPVSPGMAPSAVCNSVSLAYCLLPPLLLSCYRKEKQPFLSCVSTTSKELLDTQVSREMKSYSTILSPLISPPRPWPLKEGG